MESKTKLTIGAVIEKPGNSIINKTAGWRALQPIVNKDKCIACHQCWVSCPDMAIKVNPKIKKAVVDYNYCKGCGICSQVCPTKAIHMQREDK
jgi:pyruvate ferredoxin oxidoreductase delta subunit